MESYEEVKDQILCRLVNAEKRRPASEDVVSVSYLDLSVRFCIFAEDSGDRERGVFEISDRDLKRWGIGRERLMRDAYENTRRRYRYIFRELAGVTEAIERDAERFFCDPVGVIEAVPEVSRASGASETPEKPEASGTPGASGAPEKPEVSGASGASEMPEKPEVSGTQGASETPEVSEKSERMREGRRTGVYTIVNQELFNGAVILLFPDELSVFAERTGTDLVLLPSSVNELVCLESRKGIDYGRLQNIVSSINRTCVRDEDILSDRLYRYLRSENRVELIPVCGADSGHNEVHYYEE